MKPFRTLLLVALLAFPVRAETTVMPTPGKLAGLVVSDVPGDWGVLASDLSPVVPKCFDGSKETGWKACSFEGAAGRYAVIQVPKGGGLVITPVVLGGLGPVTTPPVVTTPTVPGTPTTPTTPAPQTEKVTAATYVYEKDQTPLLPQMLTAMNRLNRERGIVATMFEQDSKSGNQVVPAQYKVALEAAKQVGLPALVVMAGDKVLRTLKDPKTQEAVMEAAQ